MPEHIVPSVTKAADILRDWYFREIEIHSKVVFIKVQSYALKSERNLGFKTIQYAHQYVKVPHQEKEQHTEAEIASEFIRTGPDISPSIFITITPNLPSLLRS